MHSCFYEGQVRHRRFKPRGHEFTYNLFQVFLDLDELDQVFSGRWFWSARNPNLAWFKRSDYLGDPNVPLKQAVMEYVERKTGGKTEGPIRMLTHLRYFGHVFNPVTFYYCFDRSDSHVETIIAEITNTPWGERHRYVLSGAPGPDNEKYISCNLDKEFHISPFMPMDIRYNWSFTVPGDKLNVHMISFKDGHRLFDASLRMKRYPITAYNCARLLAGFPFMTVKVITGIYWQALLLFLKRIPFYTHPGKVQADFEGGARRRI